MIPSLIAVHANEPENNNLAKSISEQENRLFIDNELKYTRGLTLRENSFRISDPAVLNNNYGSLPIQISQD